MRNVENLRWSLFQSPDQSLQQFSTRLDERLEETIQAPRKGIVSVLKKWKEAECSTNEELMGVEDMQEGISKLLDALKAT
jgi:DNA-binding transcriptional regulator GbsR (MarR family)